MLSYQHGYHAGSRVDIHKHEILTRALQVLCKGEAPLTYFETHAGRGLYDLKSKEADKTGEAKEGWLKLAGNAGLLKNFSENYVDAVRALNKGKMVPRYPGSPAIAAHVLRPHEKIKLFELHPTEYTALRKNLGKDKRIEIQKKDGYAGTLEMLSDTKTLVLVDPSYEVKTEYDQVADFCTRVIQKCPKAAILIWMPMLVAKRHQGLSDKIVSLFENVKQSEARWAEPGAVRGMYGSIMMGINIPAAFKNDIASVITKL